MESTKYKILLVEDNELDQMAFRRAVEQNPLPYDCTIAGSVKEARGVLASERFDIVISDYSLGDGTAFDILELAGHTPTILVTGAGDEEVAIKAWKAGAYDYLIKDIDRNYLKTVPITIENAIRHSKSEEKIQLLSGAVTSTDDSVYITDVQDRIIFVNRAFCETYGYAENEIIGKESEVLWMGRGQSTDAGNLLQAGAAESSWKVGFYHRRKDRSIFPVSLSRSVIKDSKGNEVALVGIARDITEQTLVEDELRTANMELSKRSRQNNEQTVLALEMIKTSLVNEQFDRAKNIAEDFLTLAKIEAGKMKLERSEFDFASAVQRAIEALSSVASERGVELKSSMPGCELRVNADCERMVHVLTNLIERAVRYVHRGGNVTVHVKDTGSQIAAEIEDDGPAIDSKEMLKTFNRSGCITQQLAGEYEELNLSLPIARELVEMHGGCLWAENGDHQGNTLCFTLPKSRVRRELPVAGASVNVE
jgi:PAS domain S-box-containing protein